MKVSFITTVFNEERTIDTLLDSLKKQTKIPDEIIIVDAQSEDQTINKLLRFKKSWKKSKVVLLTKKSNRSQGRNEAIQHAAGEIIVASDAGCWLDKHWIEKIVKPFFDKKI